MAIKAPESQQRELIPAGNYVAVCYRMLQIGTVDETFKGTTKRVPKVRIGWELSDEMKVWKEGDQPKPAVIEKEYTLFMNDKANLRKDLQSWRGAAWTDKEANDFDITKLIGAPCLLNIIHKSNEAGTRTYEQIAGITPLPKSTPKPKQFNADQILQFDAWDERLFNDLPSFITDKIKTSNEYQAMINKDNNTFIDSMGQPLIPDNSSSNYIPDEDDLPF